MNDSTPTHLALVLGCGLAHQGGVVYQPVLGRVSACLQGSEQGLLCSQDLHCGGGVLGQIQQRSFIWTERQTRTVSLR